ncbi:hypothetical protein, partial [Bifidobacterium longum]|uniref:hypothetical protein n=1 Tax=Bifidobacterium longum TaxID=216816 RepID=UPI001C4E03D6
MSGSLSARQSRTNQPPGSDAVAVPLALARPTTEWHQHIQNRRVFCQVGVGRFGVSFSPCERRVSGRFGVGRSCWLLVIALVIA